MIAWTSLMLFICSCGTSRPCTEAGDLRGIPEIKGDKKCFQRKNAEGRYVNDGTFRQVHRNGKPAIEGEFKMGEKNGLWSIYDEDGKKTAEKYYVNGVERQVPLPKD